MKKGNSRKGKKVNVIRVEILIQWINMLLAKSVAFEDEQAIQELEKLRHQIYYEDFDYQTILTQLDKIKNRTEKE